MDGLKDRRKRGRAGVRDRAAVLAEEPFCRSCLDQGKHVRATVVDHIDRNATDWDARRNKQGLCEPCHDAKSAAERAEDSRSAPADRA